jgi:hypothetical protein
MEINLRLEFNSKVVVQVVDPNESVSWKSSAYRRMGLPVTPSIFAVLTSSVLTFLNVSL